MKLKIVKEIPRLKKLGVEIGEIYEVDSIVIDSYKIVVPMKRAGKFQYALVNDEEGKLLNE